MSATIIAGIAGATVTSGAAVDLLGINGAAASTSGIGVGASQSLVLGVKTDQDVSVKVYIAMGANAGLVLAYSGTATSAAPYVLTIPVIAFATIRATAQASSTDAAVNCDLRAVGPA